MSPEIIAAIIGAIATLIAALVGLYFGRRPPKEDPTRSNSPEAFRRSHRYDVFVSSPLAGFATDAEIRIDHDRIQPIVHFLESDLGYSVFWAGRNIRAKSQFDAPDLSAADDVQAIRDSKYFLLFYPDKIVSSVLFEAGIALRCCLASIYMVRKESDLPFLMCSASTAFSNVKTYKFESWDEALTILKRHGKRFFDAKAATGPCN